MPLETRCGALRGRRRGAGGREVGGRFDGVLRERGRSASSSRSSGGGGDGRSGSCCADKRFGEARRRPGDRRRKGFKASHLRLRTGAGTCRHREAAAPSETQNNDASARCCPQGGISIDTHSRNVGAREAQTPRHCRSVAAAEAGRSKTGHRQVRGARGAVLLQSAWCAPVERTGSAWRVVPARRRTRRSAGSRRRSFERPRWRAPARRRAIAGVTLKRKILYIVGRSAAAPLTQARSVRRRHGGSEAAGSVTCALNAQSDPIHVVGTSWPEATIDLKVLDRRCHHTQKVAQHDSRRRDDSPPNSWAACRAVPRRVEGCRTHRARGITARQRRRGPSPFPPPNTTCTQDVLIAALDSTFGQLDARVAHRASAARRWSAQQGRRDASSGPRLCRGRRPQPRPDVRSSAADDAALDGRRRVDAVTTSTRSASGRSPARRQSLPAPPHAARARSNVEQTSVAPSTVCSTAAAHRHPPLKRLAAAFDELALDRGALLRRHGAAFGDERRHPRSRGHTSCTGLRGHRILDARRRPLAPKKTPVTVTREPPEVGRLCMSVPLATSTPRTRGST